MGANTIAENSNRVLPGGRDPFWLFGYGSLIFKADFPYIEKRIAHIRGWERRFWQGSHDHRGTEEAPGRVVTLVEVDQAACYGMAYRISPDILQHLDYREKNGYLRFSTTLVFSNHTRDQGLVYIATPDNTAFLGPATEAAIARQISRSAGPSGLNRDYLVELAAALRSICAPDAHVFEIERQLHAIQQGRQPAAGPPQIPTGESRTYINESSNG